MYSDIQYDFSSMAFLKETSSLNQSICLLFQFIVIVIVTVIVGSPSFSYQLLNNRDMD